MNRDQTKTKMTRLNSVHVVALAILCAILLGCKGERLACYWTDHPISVDAQAAEWDKMPGKTLAKSDIVVSTCNNADSLFMLIKFNDVRKLHLALTNGFTVWFDPSGNDEKDFGLRFIGGEMVKRPAAPPGPPDSVRGAPGQRPWDQMLEAALATQRVWFVGWSVDTGSSANSANLERAAGKMGIDNQTFVYELAIPLRTTDSAKLAVNAKPGDQIEIGFEMKGSKPRGFEHKPRDEGEVGHEHGERGEGGGPEGGGGFGGHGGGWGGGRGHSRGGSEGHKPGEGQFQSQDLEIWAQTRLALPPRNGK
jgi:hypothetical protein